MSTLKTTLSNPRPVAFVPAEIANRNKVEGAFIEMSERLDSYQKYHQTEAGRIASQLSDRQVEYLKYMLELPLIEFCKSATVSPEMAQILQAEMRGELRVWKMLRVEPERLARLLNKGKEEGAGGGRKPKTWEPVS